MQKGLKIAAAVCGIPLGMILIAGLLVPGLPAKKYVQAMCININEKAEPYPYADIRTQDDWKRISAVGMTAMVPPVLEQKDDLPESGVLFSDTENGNTAVIFEDPDMDDPEFRSFNPTEFAESTDLSLMRFGLSEKSLNQYLEAKGKPPITDYASLLDVLYDMDLNDCTVFGLRKSAAFASLAILKEILYTPSEAIWKYETDSGSGYLRLMHTPDTDSSETDSYYLYMLQLYEKEDGNAEHSLIVKAADSKTCLAILNSAAIES